jgi:hypothetical protein
MTDNITTLRVDELVKDRFAIHRQVKQEYKMVGRIRYKPGLTLFALDINTGIITAAPIEETVIWDSTVKKQRKLRKVLMREGCLYRQCLNLKSAKHKFERILMGYKE